MNLEGLLLNCLACKASRLSEELAKQDKARHSFRLMVFCMTSTPRVVSGWVGGRVWVGAWVGGWVGSQVGWD